MDLPLPACDTDDSLKLSAFWRPILTPDGHVVAMKDAEFQVPALGDPRLAAYATSPLPAWLWTADGKQILWANPAGARLFGAANAAALAEKTFGPADRHRRQIARLAGRLPANGAIRLERLQGFGAAPGRLATCGCSRFDFADGSHGVLIAAGNIALIAPRPARTAPRRPTARRRGDRMPEPASPPSRPSSRKPSPQHRQSMTERRRHQPSAAGFASIDAFAPQPAADGQQPAPIWRSAPEFTLFDAFAEPAPRRAAPGRRPFRLPSKPSRTIHPLPSKPSPTRRCRRRAALPLRFTWQMDRDGRFTPGADEFTRLIGPRTAALSAGHGARSPRPSGSIPMAA